MSSYTFAQSQQACQALALLNSQTRVTAAGKQLAAIAYTYANNGGLKPAIEAARLGQYSHGKKQATAPKAGTLAACVISALDYVLTVAPDQGARPEHGADIPTRTALGDAFADSVEQLFLAGVALAQGVTKAAAEATKATKAAEAEAEAAKAEAAEAAKAAEAEAPADGRPLALSALLARVEHELALLGDEAAREALESVPSLKAIALQWAEAARVEAAQHVGASLARAMAEAEAARALCAEAEAEAAALRQGLAEAADRAQQAEAAQTKAPKATKATKAKPLPLAA